MPALKNKYFRGQAALSALLLVSVVVGGVLVTGYILYNSAKHIQQASDKRNNEVTDLLPVGPFESNMLAIVCPEGDTDSTCNYYGGDGIQQAVDSINNAGTVVIRQGTYVRQDYTQWTGGDYLKIRCFVAIDNKSLTLKGDGDVILLGSQSVPMEGICSRNSNLELINLTVSGFRRTSTCDSSSYCSQGDGITILDAESIKIYAVTSQFNQNYGVAVGTNSIKVKNSIFNSNGYMGISIDGAGNLEVSNNVVNNNYDYGIRVDLDRTTCAKSSDIISNNIITGTKVSGRHHSSAVPIHQACYQRPNRTWIYNTVNVHHNLVWNNLNSGQFCDRWETCNFVGKIEADPKLFGDTFYLMPESPAINSGDPSILDPDGSRSDIGAYGGPDACLLDSTLPGCGVDEEFEKEDVNEDGIVNLSDIIRVIDRYILGN
jgi:hypothetical protein